MPQIGQDVGYAGGGLSLAAWLGTISAVLQIIILGLTIALLAYRIRNARARDRSEQGGP
ncbi:hypothetical protein [Azospirillum sp. TSA2s]|uniref:hypothetical protein n=1 Tax=Azospirillum sp. TSA2s TaxID=709810 RepID=UPI00145B397D|nr:hypothetical protein [Azospirillum sp. TSA2s]